MRERYARLCLARLKRLVRVVSREIARAVNKLIEQNGATPVILNGGIICDRKLIDLRRTVRDCEPAESEIVVAALEIVADLRASLR